MIKVRLKKYILNDVYSILFCSIFVCKSSNLNCFAMKSELFFNILGEQTLKANHSSL